MLYVYVLRNRAKRQTIVDYCRDFDKCMAGYNLLAASSRLPREHTLVHFEPVETLEEAHRKKFFYRTLEGQWQLEQLVDQRKNLYY